MTVPALQLEGLGGYLPLASGAQDRLVALPAVIDRGRARISEGALNRLVQPLHLTLRLRAGEADLETEVSGIRIAATLTAAASPTGRVRLEITGLRLLGWLPVPPSLVSLALARLQGRRGIYVAEPRGVELDLPELLADLPIGLDVRVSHVELQPGWLELHCVPRAASGV